MQSRPDASLSVACAAWRSAALWSSCASYWLDTDGLRTAMGGNVQNCPRCGRQVRSLRVFRCDVTSRTGFALALAAGFAAIEALGLALSWFDGGGGFVAPLALRIPLAAGVRFVLAYALMWPSLLHVGHRQKGEWKDGVLLTLVAPIVTFATVPFLLY